MFTVRFKITVKFERRFIQIYSIMAQALAGKNASSQNNTQSMDYVKMILGR